MVNVLLLCVLAVSAFFVTAASFVFQSGVSRGRESLEVARHLSESAGQFAVAKLIQNPSLGKADLPGYEVHLPAYPGGSGLVGLDEAWTQDHQLPCSVNNLTGKVSVQGWSGTTVAPETANVVASGRYRGQEYRTEIVLHLPPFPYVVGTSVPLRAEDGFRVFGIASPAALAGGFDAIPAELKVPGHIATNASDPAGGAALQLRGATTNIEGDAQARGSVNVTDGSTVSGQIRPNAAEMPLPKIDISALDIGGKPGLSQITSSSLSAPKLTGFQKRTGDLAITGGLNLNGAVLYVDGAVTIEGGLSGKGALIATGSVSVQGGGSLTGDQQTAVVSGGSVSLHGVSGQPAEYRGIVYSEGNLDCRYANIVGGVVVNQPAGSSSGGSAYFEQTQLAASPALTRLTVNMATTGDLVMVPTSDWVFPMYYKPEALTVVAGLSPPAYEYKYLWDLYRDMAEDVFILLPSGEQISGRVPIANYFKDLVQSGQMPQDSLPLVPIAMGELDPVAKLDYQVNRQIDLALWQLQGPGSNFGNMVTGTSLTASGSIPKPGSPPPPTSSTWTLDFSSYTKLSDRIRIRSWRRI